MADMMDNFITTYETLDTEVRKEILSANLDRILSLYGVDEGFYVLALFSWIECYIFHTNPQLSYECESFLERLKKLFEIMDTDHCEYDSLLYQLRGGYRFSNKVRHQFELLTKNEAISMTHEFLHFCQVIGWYDSKLDEFKKLRALWDEKLNPAEEHIELYSLKKRIAETAKENLALRKSLSENTISHDEHERLRSELLLKSKRLSEVEKAVQKKDIKQDKLRKELYDLKEEKRTFEKEIEILRFREDYLTYMERFTVYTRSRNDYERSLMRMTPEQLQASNKIREYGDYLIRGGAGTGKTLVLLHALLSHEAAAKEMLDFSGQSDRYLLTFTNALVHFNSYLSSILSEGEPGFQVQNIDHFFSDRLRMVDPDYTIDYSILKEFLAERELPFLNSKELHVEIETALFGRDTTHDTYLTVPGVRAGMKRPLGRDQKEQVWNILQDFKALMDEKKSFSKSYSRLVLLHLLKRDLELAEKLSVKRIYVDEVQDLNPVEIELLSRLSEEGLVMAGDEKQAIYQSGFSFQRIGVDIVGHSSRLLMNYRNTRQIFHLAQQYKLKVLTPRSSKEKEETEQFDTFRDGPSPELWQEVNTSKLLELLIRRISFFLDTLHYTPENIAVLAPTNATLNHTKKALEERGLEMIDIRKGSFDFKESEGIRISTLHSAKGVEFPVVMLFLPEVPVSSRIDLQSAENSTRRLLYVAMTRCIDNLQVFSLENPEQEVLQEFLEVFHTYEDGMQRLEY